MFNSHAAAFWLLAAWSLFFVHNHVSGLPQYQAPESPSSNHDSYRISSDLKDESSPIQFVTTADQSPKIDGRRKQSRINQQVDRFVFNRAPFPRVVSSNQNVNNNPKSIIRDRNQQVESSNTTRQVNEGRIADEVSEYYFGYRQPAVGAVRGHGRSRQRAQYAITENPQEFNTGVENAPIDNAEQDATSDCERLTNINQNIREGQLGDTTVTEQNNAAQRNRQANLQQGTYAERAKQGQSRQQNYFDTSDEVAQQTEDEPNKREEAVRKQQEDKNGEPNPAISTHEVSFFTRVSHRSESQPWSYQKFEPITN